MSSGSVFTTIATGLSRKNGASVGRSREHARRLNLLSTSLSQWRWRLRSRLLGLASIIALMMYLRWQVRLVHSTAHTAASTTNYYDRNFNERNGKGSSSVNQQESITATKTATRSSTSIITVAHVVSLIKCSKSHMVTGFLDAAAVLRHSIHQQSNYTGNSRYSYHMVVFVHPSCQEHAKLLAQLGYETKVVAPPIQINDLPPGYYKDHVKFENCCGSDEFIKLYAYTLTDYPIVVHWDMDVLILQPLDALYDAMLFPKDSPRGKKARQELQVQHPNIPLPSVIDAFFTRDITSAQPWEVHQGVQGGFLVARSNLQDFDLYLKFIKEANFSGSRRGEGSGWGGLGYGGWQGAMAYQGVVAYFYDQYKPNTAVELNACRWNQVVADVIWRGPTRMDLNGTCREYPKTIPQQPVSLKLLQENTDCEDCRITPVDLVKTVHYTACKKPWECVVPYPRQAKDSRQQYRLNHLTNVTTCGLLFRKWFAARQQVEKLLLTKVPSNQYQPPTRNGKYHPEWFMGYCQGPGQYIAMPPPPTGFDVNQMYS